MMKKAYKIASMIILLGLSLIISVSGVRADNYVQTATARYEFVENVETNDLEYGVMQRRDRGITQSSQVTPDKTYTQQVNVLEVPTDLKTKVVVWGTQSSKGWIRQTVVNFAKDFEAKNPGWVVLAAVNGDFFDISSTFDLPEQTNGAMLQDGELVRSVSTSDNQLIGFTNDGTSNSLIGYKNFQTSGLKLSIYDKFDEIIATYDVAKANSVPGENEISVYFATQKRVVGETITWDVTPSVLPNTTGREFIVGSAIKALPMDANNFYGIGDISEQDVEKELIMGQFGIVSNNSEANAQLAEGVKIRVQKEVVGDYSSSTSITGGGYRMLYQGEEQVSTNPDRHPRTIVGKKADGTLVFVTVDGRQANKDMNGVIYGEMAAVMKYYGCVEAYNLDGGGSTTMIIRDGNGGFRIMNSPSDGYERRDSNAVLIVAPELRLTTNSVSDTVAEFSYSKIIKGYDINQVNVTVNGVTKEMVDNKVVFDNLDPKTSYDVNFTYEMDRSGQTRTITGKVQNIKTGKTRPQITNFTCQIVGNEYQFTYEIVDPDGTIELLALNFEGGIKFLNVSKTSVTYTKADVKEAMEFSITAHYNLRSSVMISEELTQTISPIIKNKEGCKMGMVDMVTYFIGFSASLAVAFVVLKARNK